MELEKKMVAHYISKDYGRFKFKGANRTVNEKHVQKIQESIQARGWDSNYPIVVDGCTYEIVDGQHRFQALKSLGMPIEFVFKTGMTINDIAVLNSTQEPWTGKNYIHSRAAEGKRTYIALERAISKYGKAVSPSAVISIFTGANGQIRGPLQDGTFELTKGQLEEKLQEIEWMLPAFAGKFPGAKRPAALAFHFFWNQPGVDRARMQRIVMPKLAHISGVQAKARAWVEEIENLYNEKLAVKRRIHLVSAFDARKRGHHGD